MEHALGIDIGTSGVRAAVLHGDGSEGASAAHRFANEHKRAPSAWLAALEAVLGELDLGRVGAIAVDGTSGTLVGLNADGAAVAGPLMYDDRTDDAGLIARIDAVAPATSAARGAGSGAAKALRLLAEPGVVRIAHQADLLVHALTDRADLSDESNALKTGYDPIARRWPDWLEAVRLDRARLPTVQPVGVPLAPVTAGAAARFGLPTGALVVGGLTDGCASFLATGASRPGEGVTALGTTLTLKTLSDRPVSASGYGIYSHRIGGMWLAGGASNSGGAVLAQHFAPDAIERLSAEIDPNVDAGDFYPLPRPGERFPVADPGLEPVMPEPTGDAVHLHGLLEGVARVEAMGYARLAELGAPAVTRVFTVGGGAANAVWTAIRARRLGAEMATPRSPDAAVGAARVALAHLRGVAVGAA